MATLTTRYPVNQNKSIQHSPASAWAARKPACVLPHLQSLPATHGQPGRSRRCVWCVDESYITQHGHPGRPLLLGSDTSLPVQARAAWMATLTMRRPVNENKSVHSYTTHLHQRGLPGSPCVCCPTYRHSQPRTGSQAGRSDVCGVLTSRMSLSAAIQAAHACLGVTTDSQYKHGRRGWPS